MTIKYKVLSRLLNGDAPVDITEATHATVLRWKRELVVAQKNDTVAKLMDLDQAVFDQVLEGVEASTVPGVLADTKVVTAGLSLAKTKADALQTDLMQTASDINTRIRNKALGAEHISELDMLTDALCKLQNAFFNKNSTSVNVQNNYDSSNRAYATFLGDAPVQGEPNAKDN